MATNGTTSGSWGYDPQEDPNFPPREFDELMRAEDLSPQEWLQRRAEILAGNLGEDLWERRGSNSKKGVPVKDDNLELNEEENREVDELLGIRPKPSRAWGLGPLRCRKPKRKKSGAPEVGDQGAPGSGLPTGHGGVGRTPPNGPVPMAPLHHHVESEGLDHQLYDGAVVINNVDDIEFEEAGEPSIPL